MAGSDDSEWTFVTVVSSDPTNPTVGSAFEQTQFQNILALPLQFSGHRIQVAFYSMSYVLNGGPTTIFKYTVNSDQVEADQRTGNGLTSTMTPLMTLEETTVPTVGTDFVPTRLQWVESTVGASGVALISIIIADENGDIPGLTPGVPNQFTKSMYVTLAFRVVN